MNGACPYCKSIVMSVRFQEVEATGPIGAKKAWRTLTYACPSCNAVLGCQIDPIALKNDTVSEVVAEIIKRLR